ncbi:MAG: sugar phosphate nucleotidyltransferase [Candidatus Neomarinimicrobiota bacterium]
MKVIIPVAGRGTRLLPFTQSRQKCLLPVAGKPVIDHILPPLIEQGFDEIILVTGYLEDQIREYTRKYDASFRFVRQEEPLGLGHAVYQGLENRDDPVLIQLGDVIYHHDFSSFCTTDHHRIAVDRVPDPERFGIVSVEGGRVMRVWEKPENPPSNLAVIGLYYLSNQRPLWEALTYLIDHNITTKGEIQLADAFQELIDSKEVVTVDFLPNWYDCGIPETFLSSNKALLTSSGLSIEGSTIIEPVSIGSGCHIESSTVGPFVTIMDDCQVVNSRLDDTIVLWDSEIRDATVSHAIVGNGHRLP